MHSCVYANTSWSTEQYDEHGGERKRPLQLMAGARHVHDQYEDEVDAASDTRRDDTRRDGMPAKVRLYLGSFQGPIKGDDSICFTLDTHRMSALKYGTHLRL